MPAKKRFQYDVDFTLRRVFGKRSFRSVVLLNIDAFKHVSDLVKQATSTRSDIRNSGGRRCLSSSRNIFREKLMLPTSIRSGLWKYVVSVQIADFYIDSFDSNNRYISTIGSNGEQ
jgi:hypothetical protein